MSVNSLDTSVSALRANSFRVDVSANNVANVNTDGFQAATVQTADKAYVNSIGSGVQVAGTYAPNRPGPPAAAEGVPAVEDGITQSNTDLVVERTNQMNAQNAYGVNLVMSRTVDETSQTLMDLKG